jgi:hypothetical protein
MSKVKEEPEKFLTVGTSDYRELKQKNVVL